VVAAAVVFYPALVVLVQLDLFLLLPVVKEVVPVVVVAALMFLIPVVAREVGVVQVVVLTTTEAMLH
jgi:hypothetical protein